MQVPKTGNYNGKIDKIRILWVRYTIMLCEL